VPYSCVKDEGWAPRDRLSGADPKPLQVAVVKSCGRERWSKSSRHDLEQVCVRETSESKPTEDASLRSKRRQNQGRVSPLGQVCRVPPTRPFGRCYSTKTGRAYIGTRPSQKSVAKVRRTISELTNRSGYQSTRSCKWRNSIGFLRLGELLLSGSGQQGIPGNRCACGGAASPVVVQEAQDAGSRNCTFPRRAPL
jgi:hypothetical protein